LSVILEETGRTALAEMRQVLGALRTEQDESWRPSPGLAELTGRETEVLAYESGVVAPGQGPS
jgi:hypothetical protein